ncbi:DUF1302 domain-containing protein [Zavarzinia sp. CC-PAN008]|uniref:DUF1302 domain-containing protein n=1 Tax=Zavarzinia sp. CC-PAN008 TaxID=3243332 RepID=UPI003F745D11
MSQRKEMERAARRSRAGRTPGLLVRRLALGAGLALAAGTAAQIGPAQAAEWTFGDVVITNQNQVSAAIQMRTGARDDRFVCGFNRSGTQVVPATSGTTCSEDNGNLNFDQGSIISNPVTYTGELSAIWSPGDNQRFGVYVRGRAFYDWVFDVNNLDTNGGFGPEAPGRDRLQAGRLDPRQQDRARYGLEAQDYYALASFDVAGNPFNVRVGNQILNWGEALVTQNAISIINPLDLQKLRVPGSEVRDALVPIKMIWASYELVPGLSVEGFYAWDFEGLRLEPGGTFFSGAEQFANGSEGIQGAAFQGEAFCGTGSATSNPYTGGRGVINAGCGLPTVRQTFERRDQDRGDFGFAARYFSEELNNTEFGFYFVNYQSRFISYKYAAPGADKFLPITVGGVLNADNVLQNIANSETYLYYPDDQRMYGISFNSSIDDLGLALNGEFSYKQNLPALIDNTTVFINLFNAIGGSDLALGGQVPTQYEGPGGIRTGNGFTPICRTLGPTGCAGYTMNNDIRVDAMNFNLRGTRSFGQSHFLTSIISAESLSVVVEGAAIHAWIPDQGVLTLNVPNSAGLPGGSGALAYLEPETVSPWSFGYTAIVSAAYPSAFGTSINLTPGFAFSHAVHGITPISGGFIEGQKSINMSLRADYLVSLSATLNFFKSWGAGHHNSQSDKDFVGLTVSYAF